MIWFIKSLELISPSLSILFTKVVSDWFKLFLKFSASSVFILRSDAISLVMCFPPTGKILKYKILLSSKILNKNSIYLEEKFDFFKEINFFEESPQSICQSAFNFVQMNKSQEVNFVPKKPRNKGFFEKLFHLFN